MSQDPLDLPSGWRTVWPHEVRVGDWLPVVTAAGALGRPVQVVGINEIPEGRRTAARPGPGFRFLTSAGWCTEHDADERVVVISAARDAVSDG